MKKKSIYLFSIVALVGLVLTPWWPQSHTKPLSLNLTSSALVENGIIMEEYSCYAGDDMVSPPLNWDNAPKGTKSYALTMIDPDVPQETLEAYGILGVLPGDIFVHWIVINIDKNVSSLAEDASPGDMPDGAIELTTSWALFSMPSNQYIGPMPPEDTKAHGYVFTLYALDVESLENLTGESGYSELIDAMAGHVLATTSLTAYYGKYSS